MARSRSAESVGVSAYVVVVAGAAVLASIVAFAQAHALPITEDGAWVLEDRYPLTIQTLLTPFHSQLTVIPFALWAVVPSAEAKLVLLLATHVLAATLLGTFLVSRLGRLGMVLALPAAIPWAAWYDL